MDQAKMGWQRRGKMAT